MLGHAEQAIERYRQVVELEPRFGDAEQPGGAARQGKAEKRRPFRQVLPLGTLWTFVVDYNLGDVLEDLAAR